MERAKKLTWTEYSIISIWICNCLLGSLLSVREIWIPYMNAGSDGYTKITSDPFDGTVLPISYVPDWTKVENQNKTRRFEDIPISEFVPIPQYDPLLLIDEVNISKMATIARYTYITTYMGSYKLNYRENDGSHLGIDIRSPIGTPILSIANGVVIRTVEADSTGNKVVVIRHDGIPYGGKNVTLYSGYLHLSQILVTEGTKIRKGEILGRVGMSGIATTPHLHIQIDTDLAPFHPYWPFTSSEARAKGLGFFDAINSGLGKENAEKYTIHPLVFIHTYLGGTSQSQTNITSNNTTEDETKAVVNVASLEIGAKEVCTKKRFSDVGEKSSLGKILYPLIDTKCLFQDGKTFDSKKAVTKNEAIMSLMKYYKIEPASGTSHFLDIPIGDSFQGYALVAYRKGILDGNYAFGEKIITKEEFAEIVSKLTGIKNPSSLKVYTDNDPMNPSFGYIQNYAYIVGSKGGKFYPKNILTKGSMTQMFTSMSLAKSKIKN